MVFSGVVFASDSTNTEEVLPSIPIWVFIFLSVVFLAVIVYTALKIEDIKKKIGVFLGLGAICTFTMYFFGGTKGHHHFEYVFFVDFPQFIMIPFATVMIASLNLFGLFLKKDVSKVKLGWFLLLVCPFLGNFGTTWALVPIGLSLYPVLLKKFPLRNQWVFILVTLCIFSMNMLALGTLAADPPQAFWAVKAASSGKPLGFFFPLTKFWPYLIVTWLLYGLSLKRLGIQFGSISELWNIVPENLGKFSYGALIAIAVGVSISFLVGYDITFVLGGVSLIAFLSSKWKRVFHEHEFHNSWHWGAETIFVFVAFFSIVAFMHTALEFIEISKIGMVAVIIKMTLFADNAAAFAAGYEFFVDKPEQYQLWYNLFNSVTYGSLSPLGNGPQIVLFLVILCGMGVMTAGDVFKTWFRVACVYAPYLLVWTLSTMIIIDWGYEVSVPMQFLIGIIAFMVCSESMDLHREFVATIDEEIEPVLERDEILAMEESIGSHTVKTTFLFEKKDPQESSKGNNAQNNRKKKKKRRSKKRRR